MRCAPYVLGARIIWGSAGPDSVITTCVRSPSPNRRVSLSAGICPDVKWDSRELSAAPRVFVTAAGDGSNSHAERLLALKESARGRVLIIVANGPGHSEADLEKLLDQPLIDFMAVNKPDSRIWPPRFWAFSDESQSIAHRDLLQQYDGTIFNTGAVKTLPAHAIIVKGSRRGFQTNLVTHGAHVGGTTTHFAMQLAAWLGYDHVYIFGLDMSRGADGKLYSWGSNLSVPDDRREKRFPRENATLDAAGKIMPPEIRRRFTVCSSYAIARRWSFLKHFEAVPHLEAVDLILRRLVLKSTNPNRISRSSSSEPITLLTCTGGRPEAFALCERWMRRAIERYGREVDWIVVDDCEPATVVTMGQRVVRPEPRWAMGENTHARNMLAGLDAVKTDRLLLIEDDDYYAADYLAVMAELLDLYPVVGEGAARYYNVRRRCWRRMRNFEWAAACQTGLRSDLIPALRNTLGPYTCFDINFWKAVPRDRKQLFFGRNLVVGIKGMPGRPGAASGHKPGPHYVPDPELATLRSWIGEDAEVYRSMLASPASVLVGAPRQETTSLSTAARRGE
jgi:hypothetical protein